MSWFRILVAVIGLVVLGAFAYALDDLVRYAGADRDFGWTEAPSAAAAPSLPAGAFVVETVDPSGPAAGLLQPGDRLVSLNADTLVARYGTRYSRTTEPVGWRYTLRVRRGGQELEFELSVAPGPGRPGFRWTMFFVSLVWCAVGLFIGLAKPDDPVARLAFLAAVATGVVFLRTGAMPQDLPGHLYQPLRHMPYNVQSS